jgi:hypothetical protein
MRLRECTPGHPLLFVQPPNYLPLASLLSSPGPTVSRARSYSATFLLQCLPVHRRARS